MDYSTFDYLLPKSKILKKLTKPIYDYVCPHDFSNKLNLNTMLTGEQKEFLLKIES